MFWEFRAAGFRAVRFRGSALNHWRVWGFRFWGFRVSGSGISRSLRPNLKGVVVNTLPPSSPAAFWLRTNGVNNNGAAAKVTNFDRLGKKVRPGTVGKIQVG